MSNQVWDRMSKSLEGIVNIEEARVTLLDEKRLPETMDGLIQEAVFGDPDVQAAARWLIRETAQAAGIRPPRSMSCMSPGAAARSRKPSLFRQ